MKWLGVTVLTLLAVTFAGAAPAKDEKDEKNAKEHKVEIADKKYKPTKIKVKKGETVVWVNSDDAEHTVVSKAKEKEGGFDSGKIAVGDKFEHKFEKPGKYEYGCRLHFRMKGVVEVEE